MKEKHEVNESVRQGRLSRVRDPEGSQGNGDMRSSRTKNLCFRNILFSRMNLGI